MFNLRKLAEKITKPLSKQVEDAAPDTEVKDQNVNLSLESEEKELEITESELDNDSTNANCVTEKQLDEDSSNQRLEYGSEDVAAIHIESEKHHQRHVEAIEKAEGEMKFDTTFWDKLTKADTDTPKAVPTAESQLANKEERFKDIKNPVNFTPKTLKSASVELIQDADAMILHLYTQAEVQGREVTASEQKLIDKVVVEKVALYDAINEASNSAFKIAGISEVYNDGEGLKVMEQGGKYILTTNSEDLQGFEDKNDLFTHHADLMDKF